MSGKTRRGFLKGGAALLGAGVGYTAINKLNQNPDQKEGGPEWSDINSLLGKNQANFNPQQNRSTGGLPRGQPHESVLDEEADQVYTEGSDVLAVFDDSYHLFDATTGEVKQNGSSNNANIREAAIQQGNPVLLTDQSLYKAENNQIKPLMQGLEDPSMVVEDDTIYLADNKNLYSINNEISTIDFTDNNHINGLIPDTICADKDSNLYFSDQRNNLRKIDMEQLQEGKNINLSHVTTANQQIDSIAYAEPHLILQSQNGLISIDKEQMNISGKTRAIHQGETPITNGEHLLTYKDNQATLHNLEDNLEQVETYSLEDEITQAQLAGDNVILSAEDHSHVYHADGEKQVINGSIEYISPQQQITNIDGETQITTYKQNM